MIDPTDQGSLSQCDDELLANLVEEISQQLEAGGSIDLDSYYRQYPSFAGQLRQLIPALDILHRVGSLASPTTATDSRTSDAPVEQLGDFRIVTRIGRGGMGVVFEAEQVSLGRRVALKILPFAALLNERQLRRFQTESTAAARLQHPHIVPVYSVGCERGIHYYSMQLIDGPSLAEVIAQLRQGRMWEGHSAASDRPDAVETVVEAAANPLTPDAEGEGHYRGVARVGREAAEALHYAHQQGVLHRDIKPSNLLLDATGHVWIADFGLARVEDESQLTRTGDILGTLRYMSPEQAAGRRGKIDARSDVYSLGVTLYELATLQPAFNSRDRKLTTKQVVAGNPVPPHSIDSRIPRALSHIVAKATTRRLDERYQSAQEMADDLQRFLDGRAVQAKPTNLFRRVRAWSRRHRVAAASIVGLLVIALLVPPFTHHFYQRIPDDSQTKGHDMKVSKTAKVAAAAVAIMASSALAAKPPKNPTNLVSYDNTETSITLAWQSGGGETGFIIGYLETVAPDPKCANVVPIDVGNVTSYVVSGLNPSTTYGFRVCAYNSSKTSDGVTLLDTTLGPPPAPPIHYRITWLTSTVEGYPHTRVREVNNLGQAIGHLYAGAVEVDVDSRLGFFYSPVNGMQDINDLATFSDENWIASSADDINEHGQVVGEALNEVTGERLGYLFDPGDPVDPDDQRIILLPPLNDQGPHVAGLINNHGDIVGHVNNPNDPLWWVLLYKQNAEGAYYIDKSWEQDATDPESLNLRSLRAINDAGQILTYGGYRYNPGNETWEKPAADHEFGNETAYGANDMTESGAFPGGMTVRVYRNKKQYYERQVVFRYTDALGVEEICDAGGARGGAWGINDSGDLCFHLNHLVEGFVYTDEFGVLALDDLVVGSDDALAKWHSQFAFNIIVNDINNRTVFPDPEFPNAGFGQIVGFQSYTDGEVSWSEAFLLIPEPVEE